MSFAGYVPTLPSYGGSSYGAGSYGAGPYGAGSYMPYAPSVVPSVPPMYPGYASSMYSPEDDYYSNRMGSYYGHPSHLGSRSYMGSHHDYGYDYDDDYYGDPYHHDRYHDPYHHDRYHDPYYQSSRYRHHNPYYGGGRHYYGSHAAYYAPKAYQVTRDGGVKTLRYGHEHFKDKMRRLVGLDPRGLKVRRH